MRLRCGEIFDDKLVTQSLLSLKGERILKIGQQFAEVMGKNRVSCFSDSRGISFSKLQNKRSAF